MKYVSEIFVPNIIKDAMGLDWKRAIASNAFNSLTENATWDGQRVSFRFTAISNEGKEIGTNVQAFFYSEVMI